MQLQPQPAFERARALRQIRQLRGGVVADVMAKANDLELSMFVASFARSGLVTDGEGDGAAQHLVPPAHGYDHGAIVDPSMLPAPKRKFGRKPEMTSDPLAASDEQKRILAFVDKSVRLVNREIIHKHISGLTKERFVEFAAAVARLRADYLAAAMQAFLDGKGDAAELDDLSRKRELFEEGVKAYDALHRALERGYIDPEGTKA